MSIPRIMNGPAKAQTSQNKVKPMPYSGGAGYNTKPINASGVVRDNPASGNRGI